MGSEMCIRDRYKLFCDYIFEVSDVDYTARNHDNILACKRAYYEGKFGEALELAPFSMHTERLILQDLENSNGQGKCKGGKGDGVNLGENAYKSAINCIAKNNRLIYLHAYQSYL